MSWLENFKNAYLNQQKAVFVLHGNTTDIFEVEENKDVDLAGYLGKKLFASRDIALEFNIGTGIKFRDESSKTEFQKLLTGYDTLKGTDYLGKLPSDSGEIFRLLDRFFKIVGKDKSIALVITHSELLIPAQELSSLELEQKKVLVTLQEWAKDTQILEKNHTIVILAENVHQLNPVIISNSDICKIYVEFPEELDRKKAVQKFLKMYNVKSNLTQVAISKLINGLNRKSIRELFLNFKDSEISNNDLNKQKKDLIEKENGDLLEFVETHRSLDDLAGLEKAKKRLREDARLLKNGKLEAVPMGYLICGPVGTGKSFLAECFAGEAGVPVVKLKNFRDRWVGSTEANWEKILTTLKNLAPVVIVIDEADASLGDREQDGDSGTGKRIFASLAQTMGDTTNRGKLIWMLLTSRPELLPVDLKRQGRAEVHIPIFYPKNIAQKEIYFKILAKKVGLDEEIALMLNGLTDAELSEVKSGADIESVLIKCKRQELITGKPIEIEDFNKIIKMFKSSIQPEILDHQIKAALAEVTDTDLID